MKAFTQTEIGWIADELDRRIEQLNTLSEMKAATHVERELYRLRAEQLKSISQRLRDTVKTKARRMEIRF